MINNSDTQWWFVVRHNSDVPTRIEKPDKK